MDKDKIKNIRSKNFMKYRFKKYLIGREKYLNDLITNSNNPEYYNADRIGIIKDKLDLIRVTLKEME